jgi:hypothetical protein
MPGAVMQQPLRGDFTENRRVFSRFEKTAKNFGGLVKAEQLIFHGSLDMAFSPWANLSCLHCEGRIAGARNQNFRP